MEEWKKKYSVPSDGNYAFLWWKLGGAKPSWAKNENYFGKCQLSWGWKKKNIENCFGKYILPWKKKQNGIALRYGNCFEEEITLQNGKSP